MNHTATLTVNLLFVGFLGGIVSLLASRTGSLIVMIIGGICITYIFSAFIVETAQKVALETN